MLNFIVQALKGKPLTVYGDGGQSRSFCYVDDLISGFIKLMNSDDNFSGPVNLGNPGEFTILELANKVIEFTDSKPEICFKELPSDDPKQRCPDINLAKEKLGWEPKVSPAEGLRPRVEYFDSLING